MSEQVSLVLTGQAIASLRESDFDTVSAIGEVVDNSLQADAEEIHILTKEEVLPARGRRPAGTTRIVEIAFGDNGYGMDLETLHRCLQLGFSTRYNDRKGIGRFGVGATLGAISQCTHIDVWSKTSSNRQWLHTYVDLEEAKKKPFIPPPSKVSLPKEYAPLVGKSQGTVVVWRKCDRLRGDREEIEHWLARTYRKFIGTSIVQGGKVIKNKDVRIITVNGRRLEAFDPLYAIKNGNFPPGSVASLYQEIPIDVPVPSDAGVPEKVARVTIQMSLLPEAWRPEGGSGRSPLAKKLRITENEGFSILRAKREVFYDIMPHFEPAVQADGYDRWWSAEISFEPALDQRFSVRNVKRGARFVKELREKIQEAMRPTILEARREVQRVYKEAKTSHTLKGVDVTTEHTEAEKAVKFVNPPSGKAGKDKSEVEKKSEIENIIRQIVQDEDELAAWRAKIEGQPCTIIDRDDKGWRGNTFLDIHPQGGHTVIEYNRGHEFFAFVYGIIKTLEAGAQKGQDQKNIEHAQKLKGAIDLLFMAYVQAKVQLNPDEERRTSDILEFLESNWGFFLRQYVKSYEKND